MQTLPQQSTNQPAKENKKITTTSPNANCSQASQDVQSKYIGKSLRVTTKNGRVFYGKLQILDHQGNLLLIDTIGECAPEVSCPINDTLYNMLDDKLKIQNYLHVQGQTEQEKSKLSIQFFKNKYHIGSAMIRGDDIEKAQMQQK